MTNNTIEVAEEAVEEVAANASGNGKMILGGLVVAGLGAGALALGQLIYRKIKGKMSNTEEKAEVEEVTAEAAVEE